jgi:hypothetical protein
MEPEQSTRISSDLSLVVASPEPIPLAVTVSAAFIS